MSSPTVIPAYAALLAHTRTTALLGGAAALLAWDQETGMPPGAGERRAEQLALLAQLQHDRATAPCVAEWLSACEASGAGHGDPDFTATVRELRRDFDRATRLPAALVAELAATESRAQQVWTEARATADFRRFQPWLERVVALQRQKAECLRVGGGPRWDALADLCEPGATGGSLAALFAPLRAHLVALRDRLASGRRPDDALRRRPVDEARQERFARAVLGAIGFDFRRGRLDRSAHPFCTNTGGDVRLTNRFRREDFIDALGTALHEGGHGLYEQGLPHVHFGTPLGEPVSLGVHESQSRLWENHVGRSRAFWHWCWPLAAAELDLADSGASPESAFAAANLVQPGLIRVAADEATYDLHVMVRFELERELIDGDLPVSAIPARWNELYREYLGVIPPDDRQGCLQDVHWSCGLFGYFPTYTLGNLYAAQLAAAADRDLGGLGPLLARGEFTPLREWLGEHVHRHGRRHPPAELCRLATGRELSSEPFLDYIDAKLADVYRLGG